MVEYLKIGRLSLGLKVVHGDGGEVIARAADAGRSQPPAGERVCREGRHVRAAGGEGAPGGCGCLFGERIRRGAHRATV